MNPLKDMINPNPINMLQGLANMNPKQLVMNMLQQQNPKEFQQVQDMMQSGQDPNKILSQMMDQLSPQQKQQIQAMAKHFGIK